MTPEERILQLREQIAYHSDKYYNQDSPQIPDDEFDLLMRELKKLEKEHPDLVTEDSPTQKVGGAAKRTAGVLVRHNVPMLSLQDVFSREEVCEFVEQMRERVVHVHDLGGKHRQNLFLKIFFNKFLFLGLQFLEAHAADPIGGKLLLDLRIGLIPLLV